MDSQRWAPDPERNRLVERLRWASWPRWLSASTLAVLVVVGACAGDGDDESADSSAAGGAVSERGETAEASIPREASEEGDGDGRSSGPEGALPVVQGRDLIRTGYMRVEVEDDIDRAVTDVHDIADEADGFVASEEVRASSWQATMTLRIPAGTFDTVRQDVGGLGKVTEENADTEDVTEELVDLETRIGSMRASIERLRDLFEDATSIEDLTMLEQELATREADLESLLGQQRSLEDQVALATLTVELDTPRKAQDPDDEDDNGLPGFFDGLGLAWKVIVTAVRVALVVTGFLLPFLVPAVAAAFILRWLFFTRRRRTRETPPGMASES